MNTVVGFVVIGVASLATALLLAWEPATEAPRVLDRAWIPWAPVQDELAVIAAALDLTIEASDGAARAASNEHVRIEQRGEDDRTWWVRIARRGPAWPSFALLARGESMFGPPEEVKERVRELRSGLWSPPFAGWAPPETEAWAELWREARRAAEEVELLEHHEGQIEAWIVSWSAEQTIVKVRRLLRLASAARPAETGPYR